MNWRRWRKRKRKGKWNFPTSAFFFENKSCKNRLLYRSWNERQRKRENKRKKRTHSPRHFGKLTITIAKHLSLCRFFVRFISFYFRFSSLLLALFHWSKCIDPILLGQNALLEEKSSENAFIVFALLRIWTSPETHRERLINENLLHDFGSARRQWPNFSR